MATTEHIQPAVIAAASSDRVFDSGPLPQGWRVDFATAATIDIDALARLALWELRDENAPGAHALVVRILQLANIASIALVDVNHPRADLHRRLYGLGIKEMADHHG